MSDSHGKARGRLVGSRRVGLARFGALALGLIGALVAGELTLHAMSLVAGQYAVRELDLVSGGGGIRILCVGDSHTYGLPLPEHESYPAQLETRLSSFYPGQSVEVVNLGIPGLNSAFVSHRLERQLYQLRPDLVVVWVGINNLWNVIERERWRSDDPLLDLRRSLAWSRLFKLASIAWYNATGHQYDPRERGGWYEGELPPSGRLAAGLDLPNPAPGLAHDLEAMTEIAAAVDTPIIFVTYPMRPQRPISRVIEATGGRLGVEVIDTTRDLERALADGHPGSSLIDRRSGVHPSGRLYGYVVDSMIPRVTSALYAWHGIRPEDAREGSFASAGVLDRGSGPHLRSR